MAKTLIIGVGNDFRGDDGAGLLVARLLQQEELPGVDVRESSGEGGSLVEAWQGYETVILVDAARSGDAQGTVYRFEAQRDPLPAHLSSGVSSHTFGVAGAVELARRLDRLPPRLIVYAIAGQDFTLGAPVTHAVQAAARELARFLTRLLKPASAPDDNRNTDQSDRPAKQVEAIRVPAIHHARP
jgi:hydrogenase maturation protease